MHGKNSVDLIKNTCKTLTSGPAMHPTVKMALLKGLTNIEQLDGVFDDIQKKNAKKLVISTAQT